MNEDLEIIFDLARDSMSNAISHLEKKLLNIRAGKANPNMLSNVFVDYYGTSTPISQVANVNTPDGRTLIIQPWDKTMLQEIEKGIEVANLGFNPMNNGENIIIICKSGIEFSPYIILSYIIRYGLVNPDIAVKMIRTKILEAFKEGFKFSEAITRFQKKIS